MLTVRVALRVLPEGRDTLLAQFMKEHEEVPVRFDGCEQFELFCNPSDLDAFFVYEEWASREAFEAYRTSDYFAASGQILFPLMDGAPDSAYYESERVGP